MHWQPLSSARDSRGRTLHYPEANSVDDEFIDLWRAWARGAQHPVLRARFADLAWELARFRHAKIKRRPDVACARAAIDGYLDAMERSFRMSTQWVRTDSCEYLL
jgi:lysyl-tRNA synthetase, class I